MAENFTMKVYANGSWQELHPKTSVDQVEGLDQIEAALQDHEAMAVLSSEGAHGLRYNATSEALEVYNEQTGEWEEISGSGGGGGIPLGDVTDIGTVTGGGNTYLRWTDPDDIVISGVTVAEWSGTLLLRKAGSPPTNRRDGTIVIDNKVRNAYSTTYFNDTSLTNGVTYYYKFFPYTTGGVYTDSSENMVTLTPEAIAPDDVSDMSAVAAGDGKINLLWGDPADKVVNGITVSAWGGTKVVYKVGSYPTSPDDGTLVVNNTTRDLYKTNPLTVSGLTNGTTYYFAIFPYATDGAVNMNVANRITGVPDRLPITVIPAQSGTLTYTGSTLTPSWSGYDIAKMTLGGVVNGINAGDYTATFTPLADYQWSDGATTAKSVAWSIGRATGSSSIDPTSLTLDESSPNGTINVTRLGDGVVTASSSDTAVATVTVNGTIVTVNNVSQTRGNATITINVAQSTNYTAPTAKTCAVTASFFDPTLNGSTWAEIKQISDAGQGANYWSVGDAKLININGTIGATAVSNYAVWVNILGFNHNSSREGTNRIHFQVGRTAQNYSATNAICLTDSTYANYNANAGSFTMNPAASQAASTNAGGWNNSRMRTVVLGSDSTPTSPTANSFLAALPSDLRAVMKSCTKYSDNTGGGSDTASYVTATTDYLFLLSEFEVQGVRNRANSAEQNYQAQYPYYASGNSKIRYRHSTTGTAANWWLRSVVYYGTTNFCLVVTGGDAGANDSGFSYGVAPGFCV